MHGLIESVLKERVITPLVIGLKLDLYGYRLERCSPETYTNCSEGTADAAFVVTLQGEILFLECGRRRS